MSKSNNPDEIILYQLPLKRELDTLQYDVAEYCDCMKHVIGKVFPNYLNSLKKDILQYASQKKLVRPAKFNNSIRIYIFDPNLRIPLIIEDTTGDIADYCFKLAKNCRNMDDYAYGDGENFDVVDIHGHRNDLFIKHFNKTYGFLPFEELALPTLAIFYKSKIDRREILSSWLASYLLVKYNSENIVNWDQILNDVYYRFD